ncbi:MAG: Ig-like domain-containing protein [Isosphaeraceae bacterium]|nr:Ig-like domain-containing protein [Isosphaeraceae bacterium]
MLARRSARRLAHHRVVHLGVETLEDRTAPAGLTAAALPLYAIGSSTRDFSAAGDGYTPAQIRTGYGINAISFGTLTADGSGQTIAIVDAFNDPNIYGDLDAFDQTFTLTGSGPTIYQKYGAASSFLTLVNETGGSILPASDPTGGWEQEEALDIEWAHAVAPGAKIVLVEANSDQTMTDLFTAVKTAATLPGVSVVSMSWGFGEFAGEQASDSNFTTPAGHQGVTFLSATGDYGTSSYPPYSPNVVAVGGTSLTLSANGTYVSETGWGAGFRTSRSGGSGGGVSAYEPEPTYQYGAQSTGLRTNPDVSFVGDPNTGVPVYDSFNDGAGGPWLEEAGTSLGTPAWAALIAIANQGRVAGGTPTLDGPSQTLPALYSLPASDYHDITSGSNGQFTATAGYDEVTGLGTPVANLLVPALANYGVTDHLVVTTQPPSSVAVGTPFSLKVSVERPNGQVDTAFYGQVTLTLANNPGGATLGGGVSVEAIAGVASFSGLTLNNPGSGYTIGVSSNGMKATTSAFSVKTPVATHFVITTQPPASVTAGSGFSVVVSAATASGAVATTFNGVVSLSLASNPGAATLGDPVLLSAVNGVAVFSGLTVSQAGTGYSIQVSGGGLAAATSNAFTVTAAANVPAAPRLSAASDTGVSATDGITANNGSLNAPLVFTVSGVSPPSGYVFLYDVTNASAPVLLGAATQAVSGVATFTLAGAPLSTGEHRIAATDAATLTGTPSALSPATTIRIETSLQVTGISPSANFLTSLPNNQVVISFNERIAGLIPDLTNGQGVAGYPFAVMLIPSGPDGPANQAQTGSLWAAPSGVDGGDLPIPATLVYHVNADGTSTITLTPDQPLAADIYLITVSSLSDLAGNTLAGPVFSSFAYHPATTATALQITDVSADNGAIAIGDNSIPQPDTIGIQFNKALDSRTVSTSTVHLYASNGSGGTTLVAAAVAYSPTNDTIYLTPEAILSPGTVYYIAVDSSVSDASNYPSPGLSLGQPFATSFTVSQNPAGAGTSPLTVSSTSPANGTQWTASLGYGAVSFSEPIDLSSLGRFSAMLIPQTGGVTTGNSGYADVPVNAKLAFNPNTRQLIIVPTGLLPNDTVYLFSLSGITATNGDTLSGTTYSTFLWNNLAATAAVAHAAVGDAVSVTAGTAVVAGPAADAPAVKPTVTTRTDRGPALSLARAVSPRPRIEGGFVRQGAQFASWRNTFD